MRWPAFTNKNKCLKKAEALNFQYKSEHWAPPSQLLLAGASCLLSLKPKACSVWRITNSLQTFLSTRA